MIDLSLLPAPDVVEPLDFEAVLTALKVDLVARLPTIADTLTLESEPVVKLLEAAAYRETLLRARINEAARAVMLAYAMGADLDQVGARYEVARLEGESDERYRARIQQGFHLLAAAGPINAYRAHALGVSTDIIDVDVWSSTPGRVDLAVLARVARPLAELDETTRAVGAALFGPHADAEQAWSLVDAADPLLLAILAAVNADDVRPLTDHVIVRPAAALTFTVDAVIEILPGPDPALILARRRQALDAYLADVRRVGRDVTRAGLIAALFEPGVRNVRLAEPVADILCARGQIAACLSIAIVAEVAHA